MNKLEELEFQIKDLQKKIYSMEGGTKQSSFRRKYTKEEFKRTFSIGDSLTGWSTGKQVKITAIGEDKFLALDHHGRERVCTIESLHWASINSNEIK